MASSVGSAVPEVSKSVARRLREHVGGSFRAESFHNQDESESVFIITLSDVPDRELSLYSTAGLVEHPNLLQGTNIPVELMAVAPTQDLAMKNVLATASFNVSLSGWLAAPGVVFPNAISDYFPNTTVPHVMWTEAFTYPELSTMQVAEGVAAHWLQAVPLSDSEAAFLRRHGFDALDRLLGESGVDLFDLRRNPLR
ncbi:suppressor of fused domain protein [Streptomyces alfalfae]|uniref:suppressor of fused domain protein n=1 Tax=Streptomyces alfalfae TaxID=1642299 RepID=UPI00281238ED|nr:suppressor of fused domain protein [Streptomyces alfalfae]